MRAGALLAVAACCSAAAVPGCRLEPSVPGLITSISIESRRDTVLLPLTAQLSASARDISGYELPGYTMTWTSSDSGVARVSATGLVTTVSLGVDTITAAAGGKTASIVLCVAPLITISPRLPSLFAGDTTQLTASVTDANGAPLDAGPLTWSSNASTVAGVASSGVVTGAGAGQATVFASSRTGQGSVVVAVLTPAAHQNREIAFLTEDTLFNPELHTVEADGSGERRVNGAGEFPLEFDWSPQGDRLAVTYAQHNGAGPTGLYVMNADGSSPIKLVAASVNAPRWSPDGTRIAFTQFAPATGSDIYVVGATGSGETRLTLQAGVQELPEWSPDGRQIAYMHTESGGSELWIMDADGSHQQHVVLPVAAVRPSWAPDGKTIALDNGSGIWLVNADGSRPRPLTANCTPDGTCDQTISYFAPEWSFDGQRLTYAAADPQGNRSVVVSTATGNVLAQGGTIQCCAVFTFPQWSPDGAKIAYLGTKPNGVAWPGVAVMNADLTGSAFITGAQNAVPIGGQSPAGGRRWQP